MPTRRVLASTSTTHFDKTIREKYFIGDEEVKKAPVILMKNLRGKEMNIKREA